MKRILMLTIFIISMPVLAISCDICGCGPGNNYIGILPEFQKHIVGLRYRNNSMITHLGVGGINTPLTTKEQYNIAEAWGGWNITERIRIMASVPYSFNSKENQGVTETKNGIGDISILGFYEIINSRKTIINKNGKSRQLVQSLWIGGGTKLATGKYVASDKSEANQSANLFQLGTGSYDFNLNAMYDIRLQDAGINVSGNYKINTANKYDYQYGNKLNVNSQLYYKFRTKKDRMIAPNIGAQYEKSQQDWDETITVFASGGYAVLGTVGVETAFSKYAVGANFQTPLSQNLGNGIVKSKDRFMIHFSMAL